MPIYIAAALFTFADLYGTMCFMSGTREAELKPFKPGDETVLVSMWNACQTHDPISVETFKRATMGDPNFSPEGCLLARAGSEPAGFVLAVSPGVPHLFAPPKGMGRIAGLGVMPDHRRQGLGMRLLERGIEFLRVRGCGRVITAAHEYYTAGVDSDAYSGGIAFLKVNGFSQYGEAVAMGRELYDLSPPPAFEGVKAALEREGIEVKYAQQGDLEAVKGFFTGEFAAWREFLDRKLAAGDPLDDFVIVREGEKVLGYCQRLEADHVGPFGVSETMRNKGAGSVMLYMLLERMRQKGYRFAWFGETGRAKPFYERAGFRVTRRYALMSKTIDMGEAENG